MLRQFEADLEALNRKQKREIEEAERMQDEELKVATKRLRYEQVRLFVSEHYIFHQY